MSFKTFLVKLLILFHFYSFGINAQFGPCRMPQRFPPRIPLAIKEFKTAGDEIKIPYTYLATPRNSREVLRISNWAYQHGYRVRASGSHHTWAPLTFSPSDHGISCPKTILVDTTKHFTSMIIQPGDYNQPDLHSVSVGAGVKLEALLGFLESHGFGLFSSPAFGDLTVGGMLAVGAHGSGIKTKYDSKSPGHSYGTFSNLIISLTIIAWEDLSSSYVLKTLQRSDPEAKVFLTNLGRTFITSVTLRIGKDQMLRSQSHFGLQSKELFIHPDQVKDSTKTLGKFVESYGRVNAISFPPGNLFWIMTWKSEPIRPPKSRKALAPYNYLWMNNFPRFLDPYLHSVLNRIPRLTKIGSLIANPLMYWGTILSQARDFWGPSKNHLLYVPPSTPRITSNSFVLITSKDNLQLVLHILRVHFEALSKEYEKQGRYPIQGEFDIRITGLDDPKDVEILGAEAPIFSPVAPLPEYPDYDLAIWLETTTYKDTPLMYEFLTRFQNLLYRDLHGKWAIVRAEWAKGWAYSKGGAWRNSTVMDHYARTFSSSGRLEEWNWAVKIFNANDPYKIFSNAFLDFFLSVC